MRRKKVDLDIEVLVQNNRRGILNYNDDRGALIELQEYSDEEYVPMRALKSLSTGRDKTLLRDLSLIIVDVVDEEVTLEDVLAELRLTKYYDRAKEDMGIEDDLSDEAIDEFLENASLDDIKRVMKNKNLRTCTSERIIEKYKEGDMAPGIVEFVLSDRGVTDPYSFMDDIRISQSYQP